MRRGGGEPEGLLHSWVACDELGDLLVERLLAAGNLVKGEAEQDTGAQRPRDAGEDDDERNAEHDPSWMRADAADGEEGDAAMEVRFHFCIAIAIRTPPTNRSTIGLAYGAAVSEIVRTVIIGRMTIGSSEVTGRGTASVVHHAAMRIARRPTTRASSPTVVVPSSTQVRNRSATPRSRRNQIFAGGRGGLVLTCLVMSRVRMFGRGS